MESTQTQIPSVARYILAKAHNINMELKRTGCNSYLKSLLQPSHPAKFPDSPPSYTFNKQVSLAQDIRFQQLTDFTEEFRLIWAASSPVLGLFVERRGVDGFWYHHYLQQFAEKIDDPSRYMRYRVVSGKLEIQSSTLASGQYSLNGVLNATKLAYAPEEMGSASFDQLVPYAVTPSAKRLNVSVADGVAAYYPLRNQAAFLAPTEMLSDRGLATLQQSTGQSHTERHYSSRTEPRFFPEGSITLFECRRDSSSPYYDAGLGGFINTYQQHTIEFSITYDGPNDGLGSVYLEVGMRHIDRETGEPKVLWIQEGDFNNDNGTGVSQFTIPFFAYNQVDYIRVYADRAPTFTRYVSLSISQLTPVNSSTGSQLLVVQGKGHDYSTQFRISGVANLEVIPGTKLKPDMPADGHFDDDVDDLNIARNFLVLYDEQAGFNGISNLKEDVTIQHELKQMPFQRKELSNLAFLGQLLPLMRGVTSFAMKNAPAIWELGKELTSSLQQVRTSRYNPNGYNRAMVNEGAPQRFSRYNMAPSVIQAAAPPAPAQVDISSRLTSKGEFKVMRQFPSINTDGQRVQCTVTVSSFPLDHDAGLKSMKTAAGGIYVRGLGSDLPEEVPDDPNPTLHDYTADAQRIMCFGLLYLQMTQREDVYITFGAENGVDITGSSFSFALEAILLNLPDRFNYSGDSHPQFGFLPEYAMGYDTLTAKMSNDHPTIFKTALSTAGCTVIPMDSPVVSLSEYILKKKKRKDFPTSSVIESTSVLNMFPEFTALHYEPAAQQKAKEKPPARIPKASLVKKPNPFRDEDGNQLEFSSKGAKPKGISRDSFIAKLDETDKAMFKTFKVTGLPTKLSRALLELKDKETHLRPLEPIVEVFEDIEPGKVDNDQLRAALQVVFKARDDIGDDPDDALSAKELSAINLMTSFIPLPPTAEFYDGPNRTVIELQKIKDFQGKKIPKKYRILGQVSSINGLITGQNPKWKPTRLMIGALAEELAEQAKAEKKERRREALKADKVEKKVERKVPARKEWVEQLASSDSDDDSVVDVDDDNAKGFAGRDLSKMD